MHRAVLSLLLVALSTPAKAQSIGDSLTVLQLVAGELRADSSVRVTTVAASAVPRPLLDSVAFELRAKIMPASEYYLPRCPWAEPLGGRPIGYQVYFEQPQFSGDSAAVAFSVHCQAPALSLVGYERPEQLFFIRRGGQWRLVGGSLIVAAASAHDDPDSDFLRLVPAIVDIGRPRHHQAAFRRSRLVCLPRKHGHRSKHRQRSGGDSNGAPYSRGLEPRGDSLLERAL